MGAHSEGRQYSRGVVASIAINSITSSFGRNEPVRTAGAIVLTDQIPRHEIAAIESRRHPVVAPGQIKHFLDLIAGLSPWHGRALSVIALCQFAHVEESLNFNSHARGPLGLRKIYSPAVR